MVQKFSLKRYSIDDLKPGMIVGRSIYDERQKELIAEGTVLTNQLIFSILDRSIFSVLIREKVETSTLIDQYLLDESFVIQYEAILQELRRIFQDARKFGQIDVECVKKLVHDYVIKLIVGLKSINHVHNLVREDDYLLHHSINVAILSGVFGQWLKLNPNEVEDLVIAGLMHDVGKTQIPLEILDKPGNLSEEEMLLVKQHSAKGFELMRYGKLKENKRILFGILQHHERVDGSGYPAGVMGENINAFAKIIAIADVYDAMAANKVYAKKQSPFDIFNALSDDIINKLDTKYGVLFINNICHSLNGNWVELNNGKKAKIIYIDESRINSLPVVQCENGDFIDLNKMKQLKIVKLLANNEIG